MDCEITFFVLNRVSNFIIVFPEASSYSPSSLRPSENQTESTIISQQQSESHTHDCAQTKNCIKCRGMRPPLHTQSNQVGNKRGKWQSFSKFYFKSLSPSPVSPPCLKVTVLPSCWSLRNVWDN